MCCLAKPVTRYSVLSLLVIIFLVLTACSGDDGETEISNPTPELAVVVFATEDPKVEEPTPATEPTAIIVAEAEPTKVATVGVGISQSPPEQADDVQETSGAETTDVVFSPEDRPLDINPLTGLKVDDPALLQRRPLMVRVGNDPNARPQVALNEADIVYEEITEWWVTRFTAIYLSKDPEMIAPIRSARLINVQLTPQYQGALGNSGGSDGVRWQLSQTDIVNLDEFFVPGPYFYRPNEGWQTRLAFDAVEAREYLSDEGLESKVNLRGFYFSDLPDLSTLPAEVVEAGIIGSAAEVTIPYPQRTSETTWKYDQSSGKYLRSVVGVPFNTVTGDQIAASNVIIYFADHQATDIVEDSNGATSIRIIVNGTGSAWLLRDGMIAKGTWETNGRETPMFAFNDGRPMPLKPGNTWIEVVPLEYLIEIDGASHGLDGVVEPKEAESSNEEAGTKEVEAVSTTEPTPTLTPIGAKATATPDSN